jgi:hypothetical protein
LPRAIRNSTASLIDKSQTKKPMRYAQKESENMSYLVIIAVMMLVLAPLLLPATISAGHAIIRLRQNREPRRGAIALRSVGTESA